MSPSNVEVADRPRAFQYAVIRAVPRVDRGEFVNVGVILYCQHHEFLEASVAVDADRILALDPDVDVDTVRQSADAVVHGCSSAVGSARENTGLATRFGILTAPRSTVVQPSPVHAGVTIDCESMLKHLMMRLVSAPTRR